MMVRGNTYAEAMTVTVSDVNDNAATDIAITADTIAENAAGGTTVGTLSATDVDTGNVFTYTLTGGATDSFEIVGDELRLKSGASLDYETATSHGVTVQVDDGAGNTYAEAMTVTVSDVNDNAATDIALSSETIAEDAAGGTVVGTLSATDVDTGNVFTYTLTGGATDSFEIVGDELRLKSGASLDYETATSHGVTVQVDDGAGNTYAEAMTVTVSDVNDNAATDIAITADTIAEDAAGGTTVGTLSATDVDTGNVFTYTLTGGATDSFEIVGDELRLKSGASLDYETATSHGVTVQVDDGAGNTYAEAMTVTVSDVNDNAATDIALSSETIAEDAAGGTTVGTLSATDVDTGNVFTYTLTGGATDSFEIVGDELRLKSGASLDYETATSHGVTVHVDDGAGNTYAEAMTVTVSDVNDNAATDIALSSETIAEDAAGGTTVGTLSATDVDTGNVFTYTLTGGATDSFEIVGDELRLKSGASLDYETATSHGVTVHVDDGAGNTYAEAMTVTVSDVNDNAATDIAITADTIAEDAAGGTTVGTLSATDVDTGNVFTYTLTGGATDSFEIVGDELRLKSGASLDYETATSHGVTVHVDDGAGNTYAEAMTVTVSDVNDNAATDIALSSETIAEDAAGGSTVGTLSATDVDTGNVFTYTLTGGATDSFEIVGDELRLKSGASLDYETATSHGVTVHVDDGAGNTYAEAMTVTVSDVNDNAATDIAITADTIAEDAAGGTTVGTLSATDVDTGNVFTYTLTGGATDSFEIVGDELRLKSGASLDYETATSHGVTVHVDDGAGNTYAEAMTVTVSDVNDNAATDIAITADTIAEDAAGGTTVGTLSATDVDTGNVFTYTLTGGATDSFEIVGDELRLKSGASLDYETATSHGVTVHVDDGAGNTYAEAMTVTVSDVNEAPTDILLAGSSNLTVDDPYLSLNAGSETDQYIKIDSFSGLTDQELTFEMEFASTYTPAGGRHTGILLRGWRRQRFSDHRKQRRHLGHIHRRRGSLDIGPEHRPVRRQQTHVVCNMGRRRRHNQDLRRRDTGILRYRVSEGRQGRHRPGRWRHIHHWTGAGQPGWRFQCRSDIPRRRLPGTSVRRRAHGRRNLGQCRHHHLQPHIRCQHDRLLGAVYERRWHGRPSQ